MDSLFKWTSVEFENAMLEDIEVKEDLQKITWINKSDTRHNLTRHNGPVKKRSTGAYGVLSIGYNIFLLDGYD